MKRIYVPIASAILLAVASCGNSETSETTSDNISADTSSEAALADTPMTTAEPNYMELGSGSPIKIKKDTTEGYYVNAETGKQVDFYYDPVALDTFDTYGRVVNSALIIEGAGKYKVDESRLKVKIQGDGDVKIKDKETGEKMKLETDGDAKYKSDTKKEKLRDGELKKKD